MSRPNFTPGVWAWNEEDGNIRSDGSALVAQVYGYDDFPCLNADTDVEEAELRATFKANAQLMAASKDLYTALEEALNLLADIYNQTLQPGLQPVIKRGSDLLAYARGGQP